MISKDNSPMLQEGSNKLGSQQTVHQCDVNRTDKQQLMGAKPLGVSSSNRMETETDKKILASNKPDQKENSKSLLPPRSDRKLSRDYSQPKINIKGEYNHQRSTPSLQTAFSATTSNEVASVKESLFIRQNYPQKTVTQTNGVLQTHHSSKVPYDKSFQELAKVKLSIQLQQSDKLRQIKAKYLQLNQQQHSPSLVSKNQTHNSSNNTITPRSKPRALFEISQFALSPVNKIVMNEAKSIHLLNKADKMHQQPQNNLKNDQQKRNIGGIKKNSGKNGVGYTSKKQIQQQPKQFEQIVMTEQMTCSTQPNRFSMPYSNQSNQSTNIIYKNQQPSFTQSSSVNNTLSSKDNQLSFTNNTFSSAKDTSQICLQSALSRQSKVKQLEKDIRYTLALLKTQCPALSVRTEQWWPNTNWHGAVQRNVFQSVDRNRTVESARPYKLAQREGREGREGWEKREDTTPNINYRSNSVRQWQGQKKWSSTYQNQYGSLTMANKQAYLEMSPL